MPDKSFEFDLIHRDSGTQARVGLFHTPHGIVETPAFMPVGTQGTVKGLTIAMLRETGAQMILGNTYHLALRPGEQVVAALGGLHAFCGWNGPILTDSGGFQLFSLASQTVVSEHGATFRSHIDGRRFELSPERAVAIQESLGSDVAMVLDHVLPLPAEKEAIQDACDRTLRWARRAKDAARRNDQAQFGIVQGGLDIGLRERCAEQLVAIDFPGYAIGGLSVGESPADMYRIVEFTAPRLPAHKPRYLMGVGRPVDLLESIRRGIDLFDCVMPTRNGRNATAFTDRGVVKLRNLKFQTETSPLEEGCPCPACKHSLGYLRHLFQAQEMLGPILVSAHNITYYQRLVAGARRAIHENRYAEFVAQKYAGWFPQGFDPGASDMPSDGPTLVEIDPNEADEAAWKGAGAKKDSENKA